MDESEEFCKERALDVAVRYSDDLKSREEFQRMMHVATGENPPFDHIVVWKLRYFAWSLDESILARDFELAANGMRLAGRMKEKLPRCPGDYNDWFSRQGPLNTSSWRPGLALDETFPACRGREAHRQAAGNSTTCDQMHGSVAVILVVGDRVQRAGPGDCSLMRTSTWR